MNQVFFQINLKESLPTHYMATHKTIYMYYLSKPYNSLNKLCD